jgi:uncharacterized membrane protein YfcA
MIWYYILAFFAHIIEGFAGFGSTAIALPFLAIAIGTSSAVGLLALNSLCSGGIIFATNFRQVNKKEYLKITLSVLPFIPVGILLYSALSQYEAMLKLILSATIVFASLRGAWYYFIKKQEPPAIGKTASYVALFAGAIVQGMFSVGGPFIVLYANEQLKDKGSFRATLSALWFTTNIISLVLRIVLLDMYSKELFITFATCLPVIALGIAVGMFLHKRVNNDVFRRFIYLIMLAGGLSSTVYCLAGLL